MPFCAVKQICGSNDNDTSGSDISTFVNIIVSLTWEQEQGRRGHWSVYYTSLQCIFLFVCLTTLGSFIEFWLEGPVSWVPNVSITKELLFHWGCTSIY